LAKNNTRKRKEKNTEIDCDASLMPNKERKLQSHFNYFIVSSAVDTKKLPQEIANPIENAYFLI